jgi:lipoprotein-anchoring transpeptidase ErfK/SrfK
VALGAVATLGLTACGGSPTSTNGPAGTDHDPSGQAAVVRSASVTTEPAGDATGVNPADPVTVTVSNGVISSLTVHSSTGADVDGAFRDGKHTWTSTEELGYGHTYTYRGTATGADGKAVPITGEFHTLDPRRTVSARVNVGQGSTYGVAMPVAVTFSAAVPDEYKDDVEKALSVTTSQAVTGSWAWLSDARVHWRPKDYWPAHTKVTVDVDIHGVPFGDDAYGASDLVSHFRIGDRQKITGDTDTHRLKLWKGGKLVRNYPTSYGLDSVRWRNTRSGTHVVMAEFPTFLMSSQRGGYEDVFVRWAVRISNNGEFIHAYPPTAGVQGERNVSHGCANLTTARAEFVYDWVQIGDPVEITGSNVALGPSDGDYYDWTFDWPKWQSLSALR